METVEALVPGLDAWSPAACEPGAPVRVGLLVNPGARGLRREGAVRSLREAAGTAPVAVTSTVGEVPAAIERLMRAGVNVLAVAGGDGALHVALQSVIRGEARWPGRLLMLPGGTLNIVARELGAAAQVDSSLSSFVRCWQGRTFGALPARRVPTLRVVSEDVGTRHGFIFGSESVKNSLELYDRFGGGYEGLGRFLFEVGRGYLLETPLWQEEKWRLVPPPFGLRIDDARGPQHVPAYAAAIASTIDLAIGSGVIRTLRRRPDDTGFFARVITETRTGPLLRMIPSLMRARPLGAVVDAPEASALHLHGAFTLDGECFGASSRAPAVPRPLRVEAGGAVTFVGGDQPR